MIPKQFRIHAVLIFAVVVMILFPFLSERPEGAKAEAAIAAATSFLTLIDDGQYDASWHASAAVMKEKITQLDWNKHLADSRQLTGAIIARQEPDLSYSTMAQDTAKGEYIVLVYQSDFKGKQGVSETVTVMLEADQGWRVAGYFIQ